MKLTQSNVTAIKPNGKKQWVSDDDTRGLNLYVGSTGVKVWYFVNSLNPTIFPSSKPR